MKDKMEDGFWIKQYKYKNIYFHPDLGHPDKVLVGYIHQYEGRLSMRFDFNEDRCHLFFNNKYNYIDLRSISEHLEYMFFDAAENQDMVDIDEIYNYVGEWMPFDLGEIKKGVAPNFGLSISHLNKNLDKYNE